MGKKAMIKVLQDWLDIGEAKMNLEKKHLPAHIVCEKNWDIFEVFKIANPLPRAAKIVDLGYMGLGVLKLLYARDFKNIYGVDLSFCLKDRLSQIIKMYRGRTLKVPFHLFRGDLTQTRFPDSFFDMATSISVIEHGVDQQKFLREVFRILKRGGMLFLTVDYWEEEVNTDNNIRAYGLPWKIFSKKEIKQFLNLSHNCGFSLVENMPIPGCNDKCVVWNNYEYTTLSILFQKNLK